MSIIGVLRLVSIVILTIFRLETCCQRKSWIHSFQKAFIAFTMVSMTLNTNNALAPNVSREANYLFTLKALDIGLFLSPKKV